MARTLAESTEPRSNDFHLLRTVAAVAVIVSHAFPLATGVADDEPFNASGWTPGACAVIVFFALSGFLVAGSFERRPSFVRFAVARARRLFPAYLAALLAVVLLLGPLVTTRTTGNYLLDPATRDFLIRNALFDTWLKHLPGVFTDNPAVGIVNGSLWSLPYEVLCYMLLYAAGSAGLLRGGRCLLLVGIGLAVAATLRLNGWAGPLPHVLPSFLAGMLFYAFRNRVPASVPLFLTMLLAAWAVPMFPLHAEFVRVVIAYGALTIATGSTWLGRQVAAGGDYSYGLYLYGWPVTQTLVWWQPGIGVAPLLMLALPITTMLAIASWHFIERHAVAGPVRTRRHAIDTTVHAAA